MTKVLNDAKHWRDRADRTRAKAEPFWVSTAEKERMLRIASEYERLADRAEERERLGRTD